MNQGIEILLARMDSHPHEFSSDVMVGRYGRWTGVIDQVLAVGGAFTGEEREVLTTKLREMERGRFTRQVMSKLLDVPEDVQAVLRADDALSRTIEAIERKPTSGDK